MPDATAADWATVFSHAEVRRIGAGLALLQAGEQDRALYLLTEGTVGVRLPRDEGAFKTIDAPSVLGELAFFDGRPRSATLDAVTDVEVVRLDMDAFDSLLEGRAGAREHHAARPRARILALRLRHRLRGDRGPPRRLQYARQLLIPPASGWMARRVKEEERSMRRMLFAAAVVAAGLFVAVRGERRDPPGVHEDRDADQLHGAGLGPALLRLAGRPRRSRAGTGSRSTSRSASRPRPPAGPDGPYPVIGIYHGWGGSKLALSGADAQRALTRGYAVFTMTDRGWGGSCGAADAHRPALRRQGLHPPDAQRLRGARRAVRARPARRRRRDRPAADRRDRRLLRRRHVDRARRAAQPHAARGRRARAVDEPARQADADRRDRAGVHVVGHRDGADAERQLARLRRERAVLRWRPPARRAEAELERLALPRGPAARLLRPGGHGSVGRHHRLEDVHGHRRAVRRQPAGRGDGRRAHRQPLRLLHRRLDRARARRCWPTAGTTTCSRSTSRCATTTRSARSTRTRRSRCSTSTSATARARGRSRPPTARRSPPPRTPGSTTTSRASGPSRPTRAAAWTSSPPSARSTAPGRASTRRPGRSWRRARCGWTARRRRRSPPRAPRRATRSRPATSARPPRAPTTPRPRPTASRRRRPPTRWRARRRSSPRSPSRAPTTWSRRACTTSTAPPSA